MRGNVNNVSAGHRAKQSYANKRTTGKEQFYTTSNAVDLCIAEMVKHVDLTGRLLLEPCGGTGEFIEGLKRHGVAENKIISFDIEPKHPSVLQQDFLETEPAIFEGSVCITNPPFGRANSLSKKFFNHAAEGCDFIGFLIPKSWRKWSVINSLNKNFDLVSEIEMPLNCFYTPEKKVSTKGVLQTLFQVWKRTTKPRDKIIIPDHGLIKKILPRNRMVSGANLEMIIFGHSCGKIKEVVGTVPSKTTTMYLKVDSPEVITALKSLDMSPYYNNTAYVQALSIKEINHELNKKLGLPTFNFTNPLFTS